MKWQQIAMIIWLALIVGIGLAKHGEPKTGKENFFTSLISAGIMAAILYTGGFWD